jgi:hypothetical protein
MRIFGREPAFWIGLIATIVLGVIQTLVGHGLVSDALAGRVTDAVNALSQLLALLAPLITGLLIRQPVTSVAVPTLPSGSEVTIEGTNRTVTVT